MWKYNYSYELYHYGVLGMKWGQRKIERLDNKIKKQQEQRKLLKEQKGVQSLAYRKKSEQLYINKQKRKIQQSKIDGDGVEQTIAKGRLKEAKLAIKYGGPNSFNSPNLVKPIYGTNLSKNETEALKIKQFQREKSVGRKRFAGKIAATSALSVLGPLSVNIAANEVKFYKKYGRLGKVKINFDLKNKVFNTLLY